VSRFNIDGWQRIIAKRGGNKIGKFLYKPRESVENLPLRFGRLFHVHPGM